MSQNTDYACDPHEMADLLRTVAFAIDRAGTALVALVDRRYIDVAERDYERLWEAKKRIDSALEHLPPEPPMTPEREAKIRAFIGAVLDKRFGDGTDEDVRRALDALADDTHIDGSASDTEAQ